MEMKHVTVPQNKPAIRRASRRPSLAQHASATKKQTLIRLLGRRRGADINQLSQALGWLPHSVRAALVRLAKAGVEIERLPKSQSSPQRYRIARGAQASK